MALPPLRSMNANLAEGATDGTFKKIVQDRDSTMSVDGPRASTYALRKQQDDAWHGFHETADKYVAGLCKTVRTPNYVENPVADSTRW